MNSGRRLFELILARTDEIICVAVEPSSAQQVVIRNRETILG